MTKYLHTPFNFFEFYLVLSYNTINQFKEKETRMADNAPTTHEDHWSRPGALTPEGSMDFFTRSGRRKTNTGSI